MGESTLILGLPTGLGKTYLAGAKLKKDSKDKPIRVLFLVPSVPLGVQQTLFASEKLGVDAFFVSGALSPKYRRSLRVWNNSYVVATPQTFYNDVLSQQDRLIGNSRKQEDPIEYLKDEINDFPFDIVVADECQRYIGETDGHAILLAARASGKKILALSATPQLHNPERLRELERIFKEIRTFSVDDPDIKRHIPDRLLVLEQVNPPSTLLRVYRSLGKLISAYSFRIRKRHGPGHSRYCNKHPLCRALLAIRMLRMRLMEDGASSVKDYKTWGFRDLRNKRKELDGKTIYKVYQEALKEHTNHKLDASEAILQREIYNKAIVYIESVEGAKELAGRLQKRYGMGDVACLVGKGDMSMDQQSSALLQFREKASILVSTSVGEEGLDIPTADLEVWVDPPSNPRKWIQRFGRVLRQPGEKKVARVYAIVTKGTHEKGRLLSVKKEVEDTYSFTQRMEVNNLRVLNEGQKRLSEYLR